MEIKWQKLKRKVVLVALATYHGLSGLSTFGLNDHRKGEKHPAYAAYGVWHPLPYLLSNPNHGFYCQKNNKGKQAYNVLTAHVLQAHNKVFQPRCSFNNKNS